MSSSLKTKKKSTNNSTSNKKLRILCLHGYRQNKEVFRSRTGALRRLMKKYIKEYHWIDAPHLVLTNDAGEPREMSTSVTLNERGWWFSREDNYYKSIHVSEIEMGIDDSLELVKAELQTARDQGHAFDGILAFSQGACLLSMICKIREKSPASYPFRFAMFFSSFKSVCTKHEHYYSQNLSNTPSLHVFGENDKVVDPSRSQALCDLYENEICDILIHSGGHGVPSSTKYREKLHEFLQKFL